MSVALWLIVCLALVGMVLSSIAIYLDRKRRHQMLQLVEDLRVVFAAMREAA
jgi:uncharacterized iron-regulated membrane protein